MAKKTAKKSKRVTPTPTASATKAVPKPEAKKKAPPKKPAEPKPALSDEQIGHAAGAVWSALHSGGGMTVAALKKAVALPPESTLLAVGWLAREGKLEFTPSGRSVRVSLR